MSIVKYKLTRNQTVSVSHKKVEKNWILIDAEGLILGRLASFLVNRLKGKHLPHFTPNTDCGDNIVVINCEKVVLTGNKEEDRLYRHHSGFPGGFKTRTAIQVRESKDPCDLIRLAVKRMLAKGPMAYKRLSNLHLYVGNEHKNSAQSPVFIDFASLNEKNTAN